MSCDFADKIFDFAADPLNPENAETALHLLHCKECRKDYKLAQETLQEEDPELEEEFDSAVSTLLEKGNIWQKFYDMIGNIAEKLQGNFGIVNLSRVMQPQPSMLFAAASPAAGMGMQSKFGEKPAITFESESPDFSDYYWKAQMTFPSMMSSHAMIQMKVSGKEGKPLNGAKLLFLGKEFSILAGVSNIPFKEFTAAKKSNSIGVCFNDGCKISGTIKFLPESFS